MKTWKKGTAAFALLTLAGAVYGWFLYIKPPPDVREQAALMEISAAELASAFDHDEAAASRRYVGKVLTVTGKVVNCEIDAAGHPTVYLDSGDPLSSITCSFYNEEEPAVKKIQPGTSIRIKGSCTGKLIGVVLDKCSIEN